MEINFKKIEQKDIEWEMVLTHFGVEKIRNNLCVKVGLFKKLMVFCIIPSSLDENKILKFYSHGRHLLTSQIAAQYERIFGTKVIVEMVEDELWGTPYSGGF